jgi:hypothetical protein
VTDSEILATIKLSAFEAADNVKKDVQQIITQAIIAQTTALMNHEVNCPAKSDIATLLNTVGYTTQAPEDTVHRRIQKVEITLWKFIVFLAGSAAIGGVSGEIISKVLGG